MLRRETMDSNKELKPEKVKELKKGQETNNEQLTES